VLTAPTHEQVAAALDARAPAVAAWVRARACEVRASDGMRPAVDRCWGDLLLELQRKFPAAQAAAAVQAMEAAGFGWCVREMWAPATSELCELFDRVQRFTTPYREGDRRAGRLQSLTLAGSVAYFREQWRAARVAWMDGQRLGPGAGSKAFCDAVAAWLLEGLPLDVRHALK